ncbi:MAG: hypothetical protein ACK53U_13775 [Alphaproteobacteria bacterium]|jgi:tripartite-type tricarboxylate transporter receptor subunit TctC
MASSNASKEEANYGATNPGATNHLAGELFRQLSGTSFTIVPDPSPAAAAAHLQAKVTRWAPIVSRINLGS